MGRRSPCRSRSFPRHLHATRPWDQGRSLAGPRTGARQHRGCPARPDRLPHSSSCPNGALGRRRPAAALPWPPRSSAPHPAGQALQPDPSAPPAVPPTLQLQGESRSQDPGPYGPSQPRSTRDLGLHARAARAPAQRETSHRPVIPQPRCRPIPLRQAVLGRWTTPPPVPARRVTPRRRPGRPRRSAPRIRSHGHRRTRSHGHRRERVGDRPRPLWGLASRWEDGRVRGLGVRRSIAPTAQPAAPQRRVPSRTTQRRRSGEEVAAPQHSIRHPPAALPTARQARGHHRLRTLDRRPGRRSTPLLLQVPLPGRQERAALDHRRRVRWNPQ
jgi:hypothetical protein